jgi:hypothetical protein
LPLGQVLYESGTTLSHVYFPTTAIISLLYVMENGASAEIAVVGNDGTVGLRATSGRQDAILLSMQFAKDSLGYDRTLVYERFDWKMAVSVAIPRSTNAVTSATHRNALDIGKLGTGRK